MGLGRVRRAALAATVVVAVAGCGGTVDLVARDGAPDGPAPAHEEDASPPARPSPAKPYERLTCGGGTSLSMIAKVGWDGVTARTPKEALDKKLEAMAGWEKPYAELPGLMWERRTAKRPADEAAFVGIRPDGTEHASIHFVRHSERDVWTSDGHTVCGGMPAPDDEPAEVVAARPIFTGSLACPAGTTATEVVADYDPDNPDRPGTADTPDQGLAELTGADGRPEWAGLRWTRHEHAKFGDPRLSEQVRARILSRNAVYVGTRPDGPVGAALYFQKSGRNGWWSHWGGQDCEGSSVRARPGT